MLEDMKPKNVCNLCAIRGEACVFFAWGRSCESCEERFSADCCYRNINTWEEFRRSDDFNPNAGKFGRDIVPTDRLFDYILPAFHLNGSVYGKRLLLLKEKLNLMTNLTEVTDLHNKWAEEDYDYTALYFISELLLLLGPARSLSVTRFLSERNGSLSHPLIVVGVLGASAPGVETNALTNSLPSTTSMALSIRQEQTVFLLEDLVSYQAFVSYFEANGVQDSDRRFGRDLFQVDNLQPLFEQTFLDLYETHIRRRVNQFKVKLDSSIRDQDILPLSKLKRLFSLRASHSRPLSPTTMYGPGIRFVKLPHPTPPLSREVRSIIFDLIFEPKIQPDSGTVDLKQVYQKFQLREYFTKLGNSPNPERYISLRSLEAHLASALVLITSVAIYGTEYMYSSFQIFFDSTPLQLLVAAYHSLLGHLRPHHGVIQAFHLPIFFHKREAAVAKERTDAWLKRLEDKVHERSGSTLATPFDRTIRRIFNHRGDTWFDHPDVFFEDYESPDDIDYDDLENY
ncbi:hypothetical protein B0H16DRAFT_1449901 [Mycena metata]|uniref:Uncharacterized protein n=1 Tax=Mycena metata TaxID=1033252 RepID=A0AAD7K1R4_9AGAR|nr:hypothetical protein B0H16DRAFT_1449901 [Mycena metata]